MTNITVHAPVVISVDEKYCETQCMQLRGSHESVDFDTMHRALSAPYFCGLFAKLINTCLGGGPLRCAACLEAEARAKAGA